MTGYYWFHVSAGRIKNVTALELNGSSRSNQLFLNDCGLSSFDDIIIVQKSNPEMCLMSNGLIENDKYIKTSILGFNVDKMMSPFVAFQAQMQYNLRIGSVISNKIYFAINWSNSPACNSISIPQTGIYIISLDIKLMNVDMTGYIGSVWNVTFTQNKHIILNQMIYKHENKEVMPRISATYLMPLKLSDKITIMAAPRPYLANIYCRCLLYEPVHAQKIAWAITFTQTKSKEFYHIDLNAGSIWNNNTNTICIGSNTGVYYVSLTISIKAAVCNSMSHKKFQVIRNDNMAIVTVSFKDVYCNGLFTTTQQSSLTRAVFDDNWFILLDNNVSEVTIYFSGFAIYLS